MEEPAVRLLRQTACAVGKSVALFTALGIVLLWITGTAGAQPAAGTQNEAQKQLSDLTTSLANGTVATVDILPLPDGMETRASVSPEKMDQWWQCRITISKVTEWGGRDAIVEVMRSTTVAPIPRMPDLRSAVIFSDSMATRSERCILGDTSAATLVNLAEQKEALGVRQCRSKERYLVGSKTGFRLSCDDSDLL
jgi:hypothetical protein